MEALVTIPTETGQICRILNPLDDEDPTDVYILIEDPKPFDIDDSVYVSSLKDLQRNQHQPLLTPQIAVLKGELTVIADTLEEYIASWNTNSF